MTDARPSWDETWMTVADTIARRSRCVRAQVGAVIVSSNGRVAATGYNGPAATYPVAGACDSWCPRARGETPLDTSYDACPSIHAEENCIAYVDRSRIELGTIYVTSAMCMRCAKLVSNSGIRTVVMRVVDGHEHRRPDDVIDYLTACDIIVEIWRD